MIWKFHEALRVSLDALHDSPRHGDVSDGLLVLDWAELPGGVAGLPHMDDIPREVEVFAADAVKFSDTHSRVEEYVKAEAGGFVLLVVLPGIDEALVFLKLVKSLAPYTMADGWQVGKGAAPDISHTFRPTEKCVAGSICKLYRSRGERLAARVFPREHPSLPTAHNCCRDGLDLYVAEFRTYVAPEKRLIVGVRRCADARLAIREECVAKGADGHLWRVHDACQYLALILQRVALCLEAALRRLAALAGPVRVAEFDVPCAGFLPVCGHDVLLSPWHVPREYVILKP